MTNQTSELVQGTGPSPLAAVARFFIAVVLSYAALTLAFAAVATFVVLYDGGIKTFGTFKIGSAATKQLIDYGLHSRLLMGDLTDQLLVENIASILRMHQPVLVSYGALAAAFVIIGAIACGFGLVYSSLALPVILWFPLTGILKAPALATGGDLSPALIITIILASLVIGVLFGKLQGLGKT